MHDLANRLMYLRERKTESQVATAIFGTAGTLARSLDTRERVRIGMWPCLSDDSPELAMGLFSVLAYLLEHRQDIRVYRLLAQVEGDPANFQWATDKSQFDLDDWQLEMLDENIALWGQLKATDSKWTLTIEVDSDLEEDERPPLVYAADDVPGLVNLMPRVAAEIAEALEATQIIFDTYTETQANEDALCTLLSSLFHWQVNLFLSLWGVAWDEDTIEADLNALVDAGKAVGGDFGAWSIGNAAAHTMLPGYDRTSEFMVSVVPSIIERFPDTVFPAMFIGDAMYALGNTTRAYELLESDVEAHPDNVAAWVLLAHLYRSGGKLLQTVDTFQRAIEADAESVELYRRYAQFMNLLQGYTGDFILIEPNDYEIEAAATWEAIEALEEALRLDPERVLLLQDQLLLLAESAGDEDEEARLWAGFERLITIDLHGEAVRSVVDALEDIDDIGPAIAALEKHLQTAPERADLHISLAATYLIVEEMDRAAELLEKAEDRTNDPILLADIDRMMLTIDEPDFEIRLGEIIGQVGSSTKLKEEAVDFLESIIERAPSFAEAYVLLAKAYLGWEEPKDAMETLLDGLKEAPGDPDMIELLAQLLWDSGEKDLALTYLNKGIAASPNYVPLLALIGRYLFENDQEDVAKLFLARAEVISPRHPSLARVRAHIAQNLNQKNSP